MDLLFSRLHQEESSGMRAVFCALLDCVLDYYTTLRKNPLHTHTHTHSQVGGGTERLSGQQKGYMWREPGEDESAELQTLKPTERNIVPEAALKFEELEA